MTTEQDMTTEQELQEDREEADLERRWRRGSAAMIIVSVIVIGFFWAGIYLLTQ